MKNVSGAPLENLLAVVIFRTEDGTFVTSADSLLDFNPVMPGQTTPFSVMTTWNPLIKTGAITFKRFGGGGIRWKQK